VLLRGVIDNQVHHQLHISLLELADKVVDVFETAIHWVNVLVVGLRIVSLTIECDNQ
jgi:hypothetical protein